MDVSTATDPVYFYCFQLCLSYMQEDAPPVWCSTSLVIFFFYHLDALWSQSFFTPWIVTLLKNLFKILSVWLCHHSVTKYFYIMASYTISAFRFNLQYCLLIIAFSVYNCHEILFSYRKKEKLSVHKSLLNLLSHYVSKWKICVTIDFFVFAKDFIYLFEGHFTTQ